MAKYYSIVFWISWLIGARSDYSITRRRVSPDPAAYKPRWHMLKENTNYSAYVCPRALATTQLPSLRYQFIGINYPCLLFAARCYASAAYVIMRCLSVCVSVTFMHSDKTNKHIFKFFFHHGVATPFWFFCTKRHGNIPTGPLKRWGRQKSRFWAIIWFHCALLTLLPARCCQ